MRPLPDGFWRRHFRALWRGRRFPPAAALLLGLGLRLGYGLANAPAVLPSPDNYVDLAASVAETGTLALDGKASAWREPGYPVLLGGAFKLFGKSYGTALLLNTLLSTASLSLLWLVGRRLFGEPVGLLALWISAAYPPFIFYAAQPLRESCLLFAGTLAVWALCAARASGRPAAFAAAGLANAGLVLTHGVFLPFSLILVPISFIWFMRRSAFRPSAAYLAAFLVLYAVWPTRNYLAFGRFIPGSSLNLSTIMYANMIVPQELGGTDAEREIVARDPVFLEAGRLPKEERDAFFGKAVREKVLREPLRFARLVAWRFFWDEWRLVPRPRPYAHSYGLLWWTSLLSDGWIVPLGLLGLLLAFGRPPEVLWLYLLIGSVDAVYSMVLTMLRYRVPLMPWLILFAALSLRRGWEKAAS